MANNDSSSSMQSDQYFAEMLGMMREQGRKDNPSTLQLGIMQSANSVKIDDLVLYAEDLYIADHLVAGYTRAIKVPYVSDVEVKTSTKGALADASLTVQSGEYVTSVTLNKQTGEYVSDVTAEITKQSSITYTDGLKKGDLVAVQKLQNTNRYVILAKVVEA